MKTVTARCAARHGVPKHATIVSPYSGRRHTIYAARFAGCQVQLFPVSGNPFNVDPADRLEVAR